MLVMIKDMNDERFDFFMEAPAHLDADAAIGAVDRAILKCREKDDYTYDDLMAELIPLGFVEPCIEVAHERW